MLLLDHVKFSFLYCLLVFGGCFIIKKLFLGEDTFCVQMVDDIPVCGHHLSFSFIFCRLNHYFISVYFTHNHDVLSALVWSYWEISSLVGVNGVLGKLSFHKNILLLLGTFIYICGSIFIFAPYYIFHWRVLYPCLLCFIFPCWVLSNLGKYRPTSLTVRPGHETNFTARMNLIQIYFAGKPTAVCK